MSIYYQRNAHLFCLESPVLEVLPKLRAILEGRIVRRKVAQVAKIFGNIDHLHGFLQSFIALYRPAHAHFARRKLIVIKRRGSFP